jgi:hypothetical protein
MKNPINHGSRDPLKPPSNFPDYGLFTGIPISVLRETAEKADNNSSWSSTKSEALAQSQPPVLRCGSTKGRVNWANLFKKENDSVTGNSTFGKALAKLRVLRLGAPFIHTNLHLEQWLARLQRIDTVEAADAYWGVSRGLEVVPHTEVRDTTNTPNYYDEAHADLVRTELKRVMQDGYICTYDELRTIWPSLPEEVGDSLGLGFVVKTKADGTIKVRLIIDASRPSGSSVNSCIKEFSTALPTVFEFARHLHEGDWMASADIADAYMNLGLQPDNWKNITLNIALDSNKNIDLAYCRLAFVSRKLIFSQKACVRGGFRLKS